MFHSRLTATLLLVGALALFAPVDATARPRHTTVRLRAPTDMIAGSWQGHTPHARLRIRARKRGTEMTAAFRGLEPSTEHTVYCEALGPDPVSFTSDHHGRARLREIPADDGSRGDRYAVEVCDPDGSVVLAGDFDHPGHHGMHAGEGASAIDPHDHPAHPHDTGDHADDGTHGPGDGCDHVHDGTPAAGTGDPAAGDGGDAGAGVGAGTHHGPGDGMPHGGPHHR